MKLPENSVITQEKLADYVLKPGKSNDKSKFLALGGYFVENWQELGTDLRSLLQLDTEPAQDNEYGQFFEICGNLRNLKVKTIWLLERGTELPRFITLFPFP